MPAVTPFMDALRAAETYARRTASWVVVVAPGVLAVKLGQMFVGICDADTQVAGSTVLFPGGGRVTVISAQSLVQGNGYLTMALGFDPPVALADDLGWHRWAQDARGIVTLAGIRSEAVR